MEKDKAISQLSENLKLENSNIFIPNVLSKTYLWNPQDLDKKSELFKYPNSIKNAKI